MAFIAVIWTQSGGCNALYQRLLQELPSQDSTLRRTGLSLKLPELALSFSEFCVRVQNQSHQENISYSSSKIVLLLKKKCVKNVSRILCKTG